MTEQTYVQGASVPMSPAQVQAMIDASIAPLQADIAALQALVVNSGTVQADVAELQATVVTLADKDTAQDVQIATNTSAITSLQGVNTTQTTNITALQTSQGTQDTTISAIQTKDTQQDTAISGLDARLDVLEAAP